MKRVLLLGGTGDALTIARRLGPDHVYSLAGLGRMPDDLACSVRVGGFGGVEGLKTFLEAESIGLIVDATHPYAAQMSRHASTASALKSVPCWALRRAPWRGVARPGRGVVRPCAASDLGIAGAAGQYCAQVFRSP